jgi:hypothetical protein
MKATWVVAMLVAPWLCGCAQDKYIYRPGEQATASIAGLPAGRYALPPERPVGTVWVASGGATEVKLPNGQTTRMLSVRMVVSNNADEVSWLIDTREQRIVVRGAGESRPAFVNSSGEGLPEIQVPRAQKRTIDLFYPLPADTQKKGPIEFDLVWQVRTGERMIAERTPFDRLEIEPVYFDGYAGSTWAWGPYWWYDRFWPGPTYLSSPGFVYFPPTTVAPAVPDHRPAPPISVPPVAAPPAPMPGNVPGISVPTHR